MLTGMTPSIDGVQTTGGAPSAITTTTQVDRQLRTPRIVVENASVSVSPTSVLFR